MYAAWRMKLCLTIPWERDIIIPVHAGVLELADEADSKSVVSDDVWVRVPPPAPNKYNPNQIFQIGKGFGLFVYFTRYEQTYFANGWEIRPESKPRGPRKKKPQ